MRLNIAYNLADKDMGNQRIPRIKITKKELEVIFDAISDPLFIHNEEFRIIRANRAYAKMTGISVEDIIGNPYHEVFPKMEKPFEICIKELESLEGEEYEDEVFLRDINKIYKMRIYPIWDEQKRFRCSIHILKDVTEARQAEEILKQEVGINRALLSVAESLSTTFDREEIFKRVIKILPLVLEADRFILFLWNNEVEAFIPAHTQGMPAGLKPFLMRLKITTEIPILERLHRGEIVVLEDVSESPFFPMDEEETFKMKSIIAVPIISRGETIGIINIDRIEVEKPFTERDKTLLKSIASLLTTSLENSFLYRDALEKTIDLDQKVETLSVMHEIDLAILSTLDPQEILENSVMMIGRIISCEKAIIALLDKEKGGFTFKAGWGISLPKDSFIPFSETTATEVIKRKRPEFIANLSKIKKTSPLEEIFLKEELLSHIRVPIIVKDEAIGILSIGAKRRSAFNTADLSTLEKIAAQIGIALENARLILDLKELFLGTIKALSEAIDAKSPWTKGHSERVTEYSIKIGKKMGLKNKDLEDLKIAALLHDIGKIAISDIILNKTGKLTDEEYEIVKRHPLRGAEMLGSLKKLRHIIPWIKSHHERFDGKGYPDGLKGEEIPLQSRIILIADIFDAMTSDRPYRKIPGEKKAIEEIKRNAGTQFDLKVVEMFLKVLKAERQTNYGS